MEVRLTLDDELMKEMMEKSGTTKATDLTKEAMTLMSWAIGEAAAGRVILSADSKGGDIHRLAMPALTNVSSRAK